MHTHPILSFGYASKGYPKVVGVRGVITNFEGNQEYFNFCGLGIFLNN